MSNSLAVSEISFWEIATKAVKGKLELDCDVVVWLRDAAITPGVGVVQVERETLVRSALLEMHADPVDRILAATALICCARNTHRTADVAAHFSDHVLPLLPLRPRVRIRP